MYLKKTLMNTIISAIVGILTGIACLVFGKTLIEISSFRDSHTVLIFGLAPAGLLMCYIYQKFGKNSQKGMSLVFSVGNGSDEVIPKRLISFVTIFTWMTHLFGGSAGREGVAVQIGAGISHHLAKFLPKTYDKSHLLMAGMAAGFGGLFQVPLAATFFAIEVLDRGKLRIDCLLPVATSAYLASITSSYLGLEKFHVKIVELPSLDSILTIKLIISGIAFGICGLSFSYGLNYTKKLLEKIFKNSLVRIFIVGVILSFLIFFLYDGRFAGLGTNLISASLTGGKIRNFDFLFKLILTVLTLSVGFQGGEVTPLFSIGASLGVALASILNLPLSFLAALGYASVFSSASKTLIAPIFIGAEVFGTGILPYIAITVIVSYASTGKLNGIYSQNNQY